MSSTTTFAKSNSILFYLNRKDIFLGKDCFLKYFMILFIVSIHVPKKYGQLLQALCVHVFHVQCSKTIMNNKCYYRTQHSVEKERMFQNENDFIKMIYSYMNQARARNPSRCYFIEYTMVWFEDMKVYQISDWMKRHNFTWLWISMVSLVARRGSRHCGGTDTVCMWDMFVSVWVCVCVVARARARVCMCMYVWFWGGHDTCLTRWMKCTF